MAGLTQFPSPCGVWVVSKLSQMSRKHKRFRPLAGCGLFRSRGISFAISITCFRPLAGCGLFPSGRCLRHGLSGVSVPLRGVGCFADNSEKSRRRELFPSPCGVWVVSMIAIGRRSRNTCFRPLAGCGLFLVYGLVIMIWWVVSVPLRGVGCFLRAFVF